MWDLYASILTRLELFCSAEKYKYYSYLASAEEGEFKGVVPPNNNTFKPDM